MLSLFLIIYLPIICWSLIRLEQDDTETPYQVLIYFGGPELMPFDLGNNLYGPGIVEALEKIDAKYDFEPILDGTKLTYKVANCKEFSVSDAMDYLESQLLTRRYEIIENNKTLVRSELSLILGPIHLIVFLKPYCYANRYNCIFGVGRISTASARAISDDFVFPYEHNGQVTNNILLDNTRDGPEPIFKQFFEKFRWNFRQISIFDLRGSDSYEQSSSLILDLQNEYAIDHSKNRVSIGSEQHDNTAITLNYTDANDYLINKVPYACRVVLLFGSQQMVRDMMLQAYDAGMTQSNEYAFIIIPTNYFPLYSWKADPAYSKLYWEEGQASRDEDARKAFQSAFIVTADIDTKNFDNFTAAVKEQAQKDPFNYDFEDRAVPLYAANYHDAVLLWAYAMNNHYDKTAKTLDVGKLYNRTFTKDDFNGIEPITGPIELDAAGDRVNTFLFWHLDKDGQWQKIGKYAHEEYEVLVEENKIAWPNNGKSAPLAEPECGFNGEKCDNRMVIGISAGAGALAVLVLGLAVMTYMYRKAKFEAALASMSWRIPPIEIRDVGRDPLGSSVFGSRRSSMVGSRSSTVSSNPSANLKKKSYQFFSKRAQYQNKIVALKTVLPQYMTINRALMIEMKNLKEMRNENLLTVYGCTIDNDICFLVTEYCSKGSLQDLLENDDVKLDDMLKFSLINDLAKGMRFLQASVIESHGYLKSSNCIINNHFSLKISDFSRSIFMSDMERLNRATEEARNERLVYRAPELLRMQCIPCKGTKEGDMYSFGIVVHEILVREGPFGLSNMRCDLTATEVINLVTKTESQIPYRPEFPFSSDSKVTRIISMARDAWTEDPIERPNFQIIRSILRSIRVDASGGIVENLLGRMEKYATNLEELVEERTAQLQVEKKKTDDLLESMLPKSVADSLKSGNVVPPEKFECVTIYFSDIVGFTAISSLSKPMEVLDMLNDLYTVFDTCIEKYDCYKVETIGDAYMVVSGLPVRNGDRHAAQIALMSLNFLSCLKTFVISHLPEKKLNIRIGMHSGPAVAGIVGKKMPRYCLFGDTVNTASRMESNGEPEKIQMSSQSYSILSSHGGFIIDPREGLVDMKGKGKQQTYWLQGVEKDLNIDNPRHFTDRTALQKRESRAVNLDYTGNSNSKKNTVKSSSSPNDMVNYNNLNHIDSKNHKVHLNNKEFQ